MTAFVHGDLTTKVDESVKALSCDTGRLALNGVTDLHRSAVIRLIGAPLVEIDDAMIAATPPHRR